jgi:uncharacterized membrane protein YdbT with pleckstrin-like domain
VLCPRPERLTNERARTAGVRVISYEKDLTGFGNLSGLIKNKEKNQMNKKVVTSIIVVVVLALIAAAIVYAPSIMQTMLRLHGIR